jgi:hypothetical protein
MCDDADECDEEDGGQVGPVVGYYVFYEVDDRGGHENEEHEHGQHGEELVEDGVEEEAEGYLQYSYPLGALESVLFIEGEALICAKDVDADGQSSETAGYDVGHCEYLGFCGDLSERAFVLVAFAPAVELFQVQKLFKCDDDGHDDG